MRGIVNLVNQHNKQVEIKIRDTNVHEESK